MTLTNLTEDEKRILQSSSRKMWGPRTAKLTGIPPSVARGWPSAATGTDVTSSATEEAISELFKGELVEIELVESKNPETTLRTAYVVFPTENALEDALEAHQKTKTKMRGFNVSLSPKKARFESLIKLEIEMERCLLEDVARPGPILVDLLRVARQQSEPMREFTSKNIIVCGLTFVRGDNGTLIDPFPGYRDSLRSKLVGFQLPVGGKEVGEDDLDAFLHSLEPAPGISLPLVIMSRGATTGCVLNTAGSFTFSKLVEWAEKQKSDGRPLLLGGNKVTLLELKTYEALAVVMFQAERVARAAFEEEERVRREARERKAKEDAKWDGRLAGARK
ncbi:hypothetical protein BDY24DRAFT_380953 [Mrakia frigida]|uniref:uncharacterized protein n=1 Tax=Mrakia frigida TaxID=29902 RepID=UPI003FCBF4C7